MRMFCRYRVPEYWIVDPLKETIEVYRLAESAYELVGAFLGEGEMRSAALPTLSFAAGSVFPPLAGAGT
jgi:Uma2 family endonuclease